MAAMPGVVGVSYSSDALLDGGLWTRDVKVEGQKDKSTVETQMMAVGSSYFETMKIPLAKGRRLEASDMGSAELAAVVNRSFVRKFVEGWDPIGLHFGGNDPNDPQYQIVGVVGDTKYESPRSADAPTAYIPLASGGATFALRTAVAPVGLITAVRNVVNEADSNLPIIRMRTQTDTIDQLFLTERLVAQLFGLFGALGLILVCIGLYGLLSYEVTQRTREIGIRTALGSPRLDVLVLVLRQGMVLVVVGAAVGAGAAVGVTRMLQSLLYGVGPTDPITFAVVAGLLIVVGASACFLPAQRAARVDPMAALRCE
jgi:predicted permease